MRLKIAALLGVALLAFSVAQVQAGPINCYDVNTQGTLIGTFGGNTPDPDYLGALLIYKNDVGPETGSAAAIFDVSFDPAVDPLSATITWTGSQPGLMYLAVKAANSYTMWNINNFNSGSYDCITVEQTEILNNNGKPNAISHISLYEGTPNVPDGGLTAMLFGLALSGMGATRRFLKK